MGGVGREAQSSGCDSGGRGDMRWMIFMSNCSALEIYNRFDVSHPFRNESTSNNLQGRICRKCEIVVFVTNE